MRNLQQVEVALGRGVTREARGGTLAALPPAGRARAALEDVASWLVLNAMRAEKVQFELWCAQCAHNVWRKRAMAVLASRHAEFGRHATVKANPNPDPDPDPNPDPDPDPAPHQARHRQGRQRHP